MRGANLSDVNRSIGELTVRVKTLAEKIDENEKRNVAAIRKAMKVGRTCIAGWTTWCCASRISRAT